MEIIVVIGILTIMGSSTVIGFGALGKSLKVGELSGMIADVIKKAELEVLGDEYAKTIIYFERDYLVMISQPKEKALSLVWEGQGGGCGLGEERLTSTSGGNLTKRNADGATMDAFTITPPLALCEDFPVSGGDREWQYLIKDGGDISETVRFVHFNIVSSLADAFYIDENDYRLEISAPYASKKLYDGGELSSSAASLTIHDSNDSVSANIELQI